jgi:hypothetical protein
MDNSTDLLNSLSLSDLEALIQTIVQRILRNEMQQFQTTPLPPPAQEDALLATFGTWEDDRSVEAIIHEIYTTRTLDSLEA